MGDTERVEEGRERPARPASRETGTDGNRERAHERPMDDPGRGQGDVLEDELPKGDAQRS